jgi:uncharacterized protein YraI
MSAHNRGMTLRRILLAGALGLVVGAMSLAGTAYASATGTVHTSGVALTIRTGPSTTVGSNGSVANGAQVTISCQIYGQSETGTYGTSNVWDKISGGFVADTYIYTGSDGLVAPLCGSASTCSTAGLGDPNTCAQAVAWENAHKSTADNPNYYELCDHVAGLAYGFPASGSATALDHWNAVPAADKHANDYDVPAGGLAFFGGGDGHVMVSIGGGQFMSTDIHGNGTLTVTTIAEVSSAWAKAYLGWTQPWFQYNH